MIAQLESLLNYAERFYNRQFITREKANHQILDRLEKAVQDYLNSGHLPNVNAIAAQLHISPKYLTCCGPIPGKARSTISTIS